MLGFLIAAAAGFLTPQLDGPVAGPIVKALSPHMPVTPNETRVISFMVALLAAAILSALLDSGTTFGVIFGAILGYFGMRIFTIIKKLIDGKPNAE